MSKIVVALDTETFPIGPGEVVPKMVCMSLAWRDDNQGEVQSSLRGNHPDDLALDNLGNLLTDPNVLIVTHSGEYDYAVIARSYPELIPRIFDALLEGRCTDTLWREKLLNLSTTGRLDAEVLPDGNSTRIGYSLADLEKAYIGNDRTQQKEDQEESWRIHYQVLDGMQVEEYPEEAVAYARADAEGTLRVYEAQEARKEAWPMASTATEHFQLASAFTLKLMSAWGIEVHPEQVAAMRAAVTAKVAEPERILIAAGLLRPGEPPRLHKRSPGKMTAGKKPSMNEAAVQAYVGALYQRLGEIPKMTSGGVSGEQQMAMDAEVQEYLALKDPVMEAYHARQSLSKIITNQLPVLESGPVIYPNYDALKETGRTSSYGSSRGRPALYPSANIQQVPKEIDDLDPRRCYRPREGRVFFDVDYTALELACVGQTTYDLFGQSVHLDRYNSGADLHAYLGSQLAILAGTGMAEEFAAGCRAEGIISDPLAVYTAFMRCKKDESEEVRGFFKHWRSFAKPVGLGFPGGLGPAKMVTFARQTYAVILTEEQAHTFREVWRATYPEMPRFFDWINGQTDSFNIDPEQSLHWYETPLGMIRRGATYCAAANGKCMQSPGAEGAKIGVIRLQRACYDPTQESILFGCRPVAFIHDQVIGETTEDSSIWHEQCMAARDIMLDSMKSVLPDIKMRSDEAHLTSVWSKKSEPTFDNGRLVPWAPK